MVKEKQQLVFPFRRGYALPNDSPNWFLPKGNKLIFNLNNEHWKPTMQNHCGGQ